MKKILLCLFMIALCPVIALADSEPIVIQSQGSFTAGGSTLTNTGEFVFSDLWSQSGQTAYGDNAFVRYQIPVKPKKLPMVFLHGGGQSMKTWESTPDGREGFGTIFLRRGFAVYLVDQPRRGDAGFTLVSGDAMTPMHYPACRARSTTAQCSRCSGLDAGRSTTLIRSSRKIPQALSSSTGRVLPTPALWISE